MSRRPGRGRSRGGGPRARHDGSRPGKRCAKRESSRSGFGRMGEEVGCGVCAAFCKVSQLVHQSLGARRFQVLLMKKRRFLLRLRVVLGLPG